MNSTFDEKGKIFTRVISKRPVSVTIQTESHLIHGMIHIRPNDRIKDELNQSSETFIAITDAVVFNPKGQELYRANFLTLSTHHIIWLIPDEDLIVPQVTHE